MCIEDNVKEYWAREATAEIFDAGFARSGREKAHQRVAQLIFGQLKKDNLVIDLSCGTGLFEMIANNKNIIGLERSWPMLKIAKTRIRHLIQGDVFNIPVKSTIADAALMLFVIDDCKEKLSFFNVLSVSMPTSTTFKNIKLDRC